MSHTQKISLVGLFLLTLFAFSLITPAEARERKLPEREVQASSTRKMEDRPATTTKKMEDRMGSSTKMMGDKMGSSTKERGEKMGSSTPKVDAVCMQTAVSARETTLATAWTSFTSAIMAGLDARKTALYSAWGLSDAKTRGTAIKTSANTWKSVDMKAHDALRKSRNTAWQTFKMTAKNTCKMPIPKEEELGKEGKGSIEI